MPALADSTASRNNPVPHFRDGDLGMSNQFNTAVLDSAFLLAQTSLGGDPNAHCVPGLSVNPSRLLCGFAGFTKHRSVTLLIPLPKGGGERARHDVGTPGTPGSTCS